jgi:hypothetical protein
MHSHAQPVPAECAGYDKLMGEFMGATEFKLKEVQLTLPTTSAAFTRFLFILPSLNRI